MACATCRARKIKCDRSLPTCQNCRLQSRQCDYAGERRKRRWTTSGIDTRRGSAASDKTLSGCVVGSQQCRRPNARGMPTLPEDVDNWQDGRRGQYVSIDEDDPGNAVSYGSSSLGTEGDLADRLDKSPGNADNAHLNGLTTMATANDDVEEPLLDRILGGFDIGCLKDRHPAVWMRAGGGDEYTGPSSGISSISDLGLKWIRDHVQGSDTLCSTILDIRDSVLSHLRQPKCVPRGPCSSPGTPPGLKPILASDVAKYVDAYFSTVQTIFPILDRAEFEAQLATHGIDAPAAMYSWKALLNAVLASGCRAALSDETAEAFQASGREAWDYFQNALYYEAKINHGATDLSAVKALAVMTVFAQGISSPQRLEYTLSSAASRLAQSIALNHRPPRAWSLTESEQRERNRLFWSLYCLDKTIALRCGRPAIIHDQDISCCFPHGIQVSQGQDLGIGLGQGQGQGQGQQQQQQQQHFDFFLCLTKLARICGNISQRLYSASALCSPSPALHATAVQTLQDLETWRQSIPPEMQPGKPFGRICGASGPARTQLLVLHSSYHYALCAIYRRFSPIFTQDDVEARRFNPQTTHASHIEAARSMVLLTKYLDIESFTPGWLVFYYPMTALTTIFMHVVCRRPDETTTQNDIALMEVIVGFFGRLEYVTSGEAAFTKTTEFVRQARAVVKGAAFGGGTVENSSYLGGLLPGPDRGPSFADHHHRMDGSGGASSMFMRAHQGLPGQPSLVAEAPEPSGAATTMDHGMGVAQQLSPPASFSAELVRLLASPSGEIPNEHWLGMWMSAGQTVDTTTT